ncbi:MAG: sulfatase-like hydrolase/transferase [Candidatus Omnitrophica bacterium]|nr:sulfatase-like hydrolase/transferase [Candidatus Omnitrophota bacterium]
MEEKIVLISKDILRADYLPAYGNKYWKTPNIDELACKGTIFRRHYVSSPSTGMGFTCMFSGLNAYELERKSFTVVDEFKQAATLFDLLVEKGYACHVLWDEFWWEKIGYPYSKCYGPSTVFHNIKIGQMVGPHKIDKSEVAEGQGEKTIEKITAEVDSIKDDKLFLWIHLPHVVYGRTAYGSDIDLFDRLVGDIRNRFSDGSIYITADHGHMNCEKGLPIYGFHVYEGAVRIPLITPRIDNMGEVRFPTSNIQLKDIILNKKLARPDYVFCDTQYYAQPHRKLAVIKDNYKYIYNKWDGTEELYDCEWDKNEDVNLLKKKWFDRDRFRWYHTAEIYFYPYYEKAYEYYRLLKAKKDEIWRKSAFLEEAINLLKYQAKAFLKKIENIKKR